VTPAQRTRDLIRFLSAHRLRKPRRVLPRQLAPNTVRLEYFRAVVATALAPARRLVETQLLPDLADARGDHLDAGGPKVTKSMERITKQFWEQTFAPKEVAALAAKFADRTAKFQKDQLQKQVRAAVGADVLGPEPDLRDAADDFVAENVALIKSIPTSYFSDVEKAVTRGVASGATHQAIAKTLTERYGVAESKAKLIARDQVGKYYGKLNQVRQTAMGVDGYLWRGVNDNRERDEHVEREGEKFTWDDPPEDGHPGEPINCRCYAEPDFSGILGDEDD
jgi:SPP1 gp7 family putative phage head morphogenesis protein